MFALKWQDMPALSLGQDANLQSDWDRLNAQRGNLPFLSSTALISALSVFGQGGERLLVGQSGERIAAMLLLIDAGKLRWQTFQPSQIPLGAWVAEGSRSIEEVAHSLLHDGPMKLSLSLSLTQVDPLFAPRCDDTSESRHDDYIDTAWVDIGKNLRQNMRKQRNKLQAEGIKVEMRVWRTATDMPDAIARYGALEGQGWKAQEGTAIRPDNAQGRFYTELLSSAAAKGEAAVYEYLFDDKPVAINLCLRRGHTLTVLKTTYDESIKIYSPAFLLNEEMTQSLFQAQEIQRLEYYGSLMEWHTRWTDNRRTLYHLTMFRNSVVKRLAESLAHRNTSP